MNTRPAAFAGSFYPEDPKELQETIKKYLNEVEIEKIKGDIKALIVPHAGYQYSAPIAAFGYKAIQQSAVSGHLSDITLIGPSHRTPFSNFALCDFDTWKTPLGKVKVSQKNKKMQMNEHFSAINEAHMFEHSIEVQLPFLQTVLKRDFQITPILTGKFDDYKEAAGVVKKLTDDETLLIISSDLSHYLPYEEAQRIDKVTISKILNSCLSKPQQKQVKSRISSESACGASGINITVELAKQLGWKAKLLDYRNSGDTAGDKDQVVGYAAIVFMD